MKQAVLQNPSSKLVFREMPVIHIVMYNSGIKDTQVQSKTLYTKSITGELNADMIDKDYVSKAQGNPERKQIQEKSKAIERQNSQYR